MRFGLVPLLSMVLTFGSAASALIIPPDCEAQNGNTYYFPEELSGGLTLYNVTNRDANWTAVVRLTSCEAGQEIFIAHENGASPEETRATIYRLIADQSRYSFEDVAERVRRQDISAAVQPIAADGCVCAIERN